MKAALPPDETARLAALRRYDILDTPPEAAFDDIVQLATEICRTPVGMISLVDENRQWFKAKVGVEVSESPRDESFCAHAILHPRTTTQAPDATQDPRFADLQMVVYYPHVRFYAGAPLVTPDGHALGTLCVIDQVPRALEEGQFKALAALSRQLATLLEMRRAAIEGRRTIADLRELADAERARAERELKAARDQARPLAGLLPLCGRCQKVRADRGYWASVEDYVKKNGPGVGVDGLCPECRGQTAGGAGGGAPCYTDC